MALRVIGAGMGRTGTSSMKRALEILGFAPCYHMEDVIAHPAHVPFWEAAGRGEAVDWRAFFAQWGAAVDGPPCFYYRDLMIAFPDAKVVLTIRPAEAWYDSMAKTLVPLLVRFPNRLVGPYLPFVGGAFRSVRDSPLRRDVIPRFADRAFVLRAFGDWAEEVKRSVPPERLLVFDVKDGWAPLCAFLGVPVPAEPFPRVNDAREFARIVRIVTIVSWIVLLSPPLWPVVLLARWLTRNR